MPLELQSHPVPSFFGLTPAALAAQVSAWDWPRYRAEQLLDWVYRKGVTDLAQMTNLAPRDRQKLAEHMSLLSAAVARQQSSADGTIKLLLTWQNGRTAETVMIPDGRRRTACVSCQSGCPVGCKFCASGLNGLQGNLSPAQIVEQIASLNRTLAPTGQRITNIVFMGMGEPLANYDNVVAAVNILHDPKCFSFSARRITISTVGIPGRIRNLADEKLPVNLAFSLHAPNEALRKELIPWAEHFALDEILDALRYYFQRTGREITLEYILLAGVNDRPEHARQLASLSRTLRANVNLIRYNEVADLPYRRPDDRDVAQFQQILRHNAVNAHVRKSRGRDIDAACGQLRRREASESER